MMLEKNRDFSVDAAKGIGIIAVVLGHSGNPDLSVWVNWFHMPLFFLLSGYFFQPRTTKDSLIDYIIKQFKVLMPSYFIYGIIILLLTNITDFSGLVTGFGNLIYGGSKLAGVFGPFWFITSFLLTKIVFAILQYFLQYYLNDHKEMVYFIVAALFILGQAISAEPYLQNMDYVWSIETLTVTLYFYTIGYYAKDWIHKLIKNHWTWISGFVIFGFLIYLYNQNIYIYEFNVKDTIFQDIFFDATIPLWLAVGVFAFSYNLPEKAQQNLSVLGQQSLTIMYLHIFLIVASDFVLAPLNLPEILLIIVKATIGLALPLLFKAAVKKYLPKYQSLF